MSDNSQAGTASSQLACRRAIAVSLAAILLSLVTFGAPPAAAGSSSAQIISYDVNTRRNDQGLGSLREDAAINRIAQQWAVAMAERDDLRHNPNLVRQVGQIEPSWRGLAENIGVGETIQDVIDELWRSREHRNNVLGNFDRFGVGVVKQHGLYWVTQVFLLGPAPRPATTAPPRTTTTRRARPRPTVPAVTAPPVTSPPTTVAPTTTVPPTTTTTRPPTFVVVAPPLAAAVDEVCGARVASGWLPIPVPVGCADADSVDVSKASIDSILATVLGG